MKQYIASFLLGAAALGTSGTLTSCNDYLDKYPDKRMELRTPDHLAQLLTSAYPQVHPAYLLEMYSDNTDRHLSPSWGEVDRFQREAYQWDDITDVGENESPQMIWNAHYLAVNTANEVLSFIRKQKDQSPFRAQSGEAKLCRAYAMLSLANVFCEAYDPATAASHLGLPYPENPEDRPGLTYKRGTLAELYARIDQDITEGLAEVGSAYTAPKFHFTPEAAHAFAARFYLYKQEWQKAVDHATKALGSHPENQLRNWALWNKQGLNGEAMPNEYVRSGAKTNLLLQVVVSAWGLYSGPYGTGGRYCHGRSVSDKERSTLPALGAKARALSTTPWVATRDKRRLRSKSSRSTSNTRTVRPVSVATIRSIRCSTPTKRSWFAPKPTLVSSNTSRPQPTSTRK